MSITLNIKDLEFNNGDLALVQIIFVKSIHEKDEELFKYVLKNFTSNALEFIRDLEERGYVKLLVDEFNGLDITVEEVALRSTLDGLFKEETNESNEVLKYLNDKVVGENKRGFSLKSAANRKFIKARLAEGYTIDDLKSVIDYTTKSWKGTSMEIYLRPETLFNATKFDGYLVLANKVKQKNSNGGIFTLAAKDTGA